MWNLLFIIGCGIAASTLVALAAMLFGMLRQGLTSLIIASVLLVPFGVLLAILTGWSLATCPPNCPDNVLNIQIWMFGCSLILLGVAAAISGVQQLPALVEMTKWDF